MKSRSTKRRTDAVAERSTGRVGPFPYHRANKIVKRNRKIQAQLMESEAQPKIKTPN